MVAAAAYRRATVLNDVKEGTAWDYSNKSGVIHSELIIPENAPLWVKELHALHDVDPSAAAEQLWNKVEASEKRVDSQLAREIEFALPIELTQEQNILLAREFIHDQFALRGMICDWNIHWDDHNPHVHLLLTMRELTEDGFGKRALQWNNRALLNEWRQQWAEYANFHLRQNQQEVQIDHRSYEEQGIDLIPSTHQGKAVCDMERRGIATDIMREANENRRDNLRRIADKPGVLLQKLTSQSATFTSQQLGQELGRYVNDLGQFSMQEDGQSESPTLTPDKIAKIFQSIEQHESIFTERSIANAVTSHTENVDEFAKAIIQLKTSPELLHLGVGEDGRDRFTTRKMFELENEVQTLADRLRESAHVKIPKRQIEKSLARYQQSAGKQLTNEQLNAVHHILKGSAISCIVGRAGTGKSFSLGAAKAIWEERGLRVQGIALSGIAADGLSKDAGIPSRTIASFSHAVKEGKIALNHHDVVVMDEAGMTDSVSLLAVLKAVREARAKLVLVGDPAQLQPVGPGASFRALVERLGFAEIQTVYRQQEQWQKDATIALSAGRVTDALTAYDEHGCIHFERNEIDAMSQLVSDWQRSRTEQSKDLSQYLVITHRNEDVNELNLRLRQTRIQQGEIAQGYQVTSKQGKMSIAQDDRILFLKNDRRLGVANGRFATIKTVAFTESGKVQNFTVQLDGTNQNININPEEYRDFAYGYAATVHKVQGMTVDHAFVYARGIWDRSLTYVALSRHRQTCHLYAAKTSYQNQSLLERSLGRFAMKDSLLDFPLAFAERRNIDNSQLLTLLPAHLSKRLKALKDRVADEYEQFMFPEKVAARKHFLAEEQLRGLKSDARREDAKSVAAYVDANKHVGVSWQALQYKLYALGLDGISYEKSTFELISNTAEYAAFQNAMQSRNQAAFVIAQEPGRYTTALDMYGIEIQKINIQCAQHQCFARVNDYALACASGKSIHRDRIAAEIQKNVKAHYPAMQQALVNSAELKRHALAHEKRLLFKSLDREAKKGFNIVEAYLESVKKAGDWWATEMKDVKGPLKHSILLRSDILSRERDHLASKILKDRTKYDSALDFYQVGLAVPQFGQPTTEQQLKYAEARWYKLQQAASRHDLRQRVADYHKALYKGDIQTRMRLAQIIMHDTKSHHGSIIGLGANTKVVWQAIRADANLYDRYELLQTLDDQQIKGFKTVEAYYAAKRAHSTAFCELFTSKKISLLSDNAFNAVIASHIMRHTEERNRLAAEIGANLDVHQAGLEYFKIDPAELQPQADKHQCLESIQSYKNQTNLLLKSEFANIIINDAKAHHGFVLQHELNWKAIYQDARISQRQQLFSGLSSDEKALHRLAERYRQTNKNAGKLFGRLKTASPNSSLSKRDTQRVNHLFAKRDNLAWRWVNSAYQNNPAAFRETSESLRLNADKLLHQHAKQSERLEVVERYQAAYSNVIKSTRAVQHMLNQSKVVEQAAMKDALFSIEILEGLRKCHRLNDIDAFSYALQVHGLSKSDFIKQESVIISIKEQLKALADLQNINTQQIAAENRTKIIHAVNNTTANYQRIDINRLRTELNAKSEEITKHYLGDPKTRHGNTWRYGANKGSMVITVRGEKQGLWRDFQTNEGGDMLRLIQHSMATSSFKEVLQEAKRFQDGYSSFSQPMITPKQNKQEKDMSLDQHTQEKIHKAQAVYNGTKPITGTIAERYLREHRGIKNELYAKTFRYHPNLKNWMNGKHYPALVVVARDNQDEVCGVQAIFLDAQSAKKAAIGSHAKLSRGLIGEGTIVHPGHATGKVAFAEGPETALSVAEAHPDWKVYVTFGVSNFTTSALNSGSKSVVICADNDGPDSGTAKSVTRAAKALTSQGIGVIVTEPIKPDNQTKWDFNDALLQQGVDQVKKALDHPTQEHAGVSTNKIAAALDATLLSTKDHSAVSIPEKNAIEKSPTSEQTMEDVLTQYLEMEIECDVLVTERHKVNFADGVDPKLKREISAKSIASASKIRDFSAEAIKHPEIKQELENLRSINLEPLANRGGYIGIRERVKKSGWVKKDMQIILVRMRSKAHSQSWSNSLAQTNSNKIKIH